METSTHPSVLKEGLLIAAVMWPGPAVLIGMLILRNEELDPLMETAIYCLLALAFVVAAFVLLSRSFSEPPDFRHPD